MLYDSLGIDEVTFVGTFYYVEGVERMQRFINDPFCMLQ